MSILRILAVTITMMVFLGCSSTEDEQKTKAQKNLPNETGAGMATQLKQPLIDAEAARKLSHDRLRKIDESTKE